MSFKQLDVKQFGHHDGTVNPGAVLQKGLRYEG